jgi:hypothetical protein
MLRSRGSRKLACFSVLVGAIQYDLAPFLNRKGADVWIEDLASNAVTVGFSCHNSLARAELFDWLKERLTRLMRPGSHLQVLTDSGTITLRAPFATVAPGTYLPSAALLAVGM